MVGKLNWRISQKNSQVGARRSLASSGTSTLASLEVRRIWTLGPSVVVMESIVGCMSRCEACDAHL